MEREDRDRVRVCVVVVDVLEWINQIGATAIGCRTQSGSFLIRFRMLSSRWVTAVDRVDWGTVDWRRFVSRGVLRFAEQRAHVQVLELCSRVF